ncbi:MAG: D-alanyl-D-alanine dipeptidase, partial [Mesorhizobium sp.]
SCRTSPPQGGRLAASALRPSSNAGDWRSTTRHPISPLEGEMSGRTEGGAKERGMSALATGASSS